MDTLILEDFRCFAGRNEIPIRPLTLLVGENSTGKTSFLAAVRAAHDLRSGNAPDFNEPPFNLGSYDEIANYRGGRAGRAKSFAVGQKFTARGGKIIGLPKLSGEETCIEARFESRAAQSVISEFQIRSGRYALRIKSPDHGEVTVSLLVDDEVVREQRVDEPPLRDSLEDIKPVLRFARHAVLEDHIGLFPSDDKENFNMFFNALGFSQLNDLPRAYALDPTRPLPRRTYEPTKEAHASRGAQLPLLLARLLEGYEKAVIMSELDAFGESSGLYSSLSIRDLGRTESAPFQVTVKHPGGGPRRNLADVGYGVSQIMPVIADIAWHVAADTPGTLLIQQPEVHLHPRAQAEFGTLITESVASSPTRMIVETHSDYVIDRVRMDVRDERIKASDVLILYFEQAKGGVKIHPIEIDAAGNITGVPADYRRFFLDEQRRFLGVD